MIDRAARNRLALLLRRFAIGRMTNDDFEDSAPDSSIDPVIEAVCGRAWQFYDDNRKHRLVGRDRLTPNERREFVRWAAFLRSNQPYEWPRYDFEYVEALSVFDLLFGRRALRSSRDHWRSFAFRGHFDVWPFLRRNEMSDELRRPSYLCGRRAPSQS